MGFFHKWSWAKMKKGASLHSMQAVYIVYSVDCTTGGHNIDHTAWANKKWGTYLCHKAQILLKNLLKNSPFFAIFFVNVGQKSTN